MWYTQHAQVLEGLAITAFTHAARPDRSPQVDYRGKTQRSLSGQRRDLPKHTDLGLVCSLTRDPRYIDCLL